MNITPRQFWQNQIRRILLLLAVWALVGFGCSIFFVEHLNAITLGGIPFGMWMAQQGSIFVFIVLIYIYATLTDKAEIEAGLQETDTTTSGASDAH